MGPEVADGPNEAGEDGMKRAIATALVTATFLAAAKNREWQIGTVLRSQREIACSRPYDCVFQDFQIEGEKKIYAARELLKYRWSKEANVSVNERVKFALDPHERKLFLLDDEGKEHELEIISKELKR
ncbi:MAG: hypothetical protein KGL39_20430 [Patescibacteria group bacterium]|nr:hypothetical protein [Patescibacteria group bacterium]